MIVVSQKGVKIKIAKEDFAKFMTNFNYLLRNLYKIWYLACLAVKIKNTDKDAYENILDHLKGFNLPDRIIDLIYNLNPVGVGGDLNFNPKKIFASFAEKEIKGGDNYQ